MTRYPNRGKGTKWFVRELLAITDEWKGDTLNDSEGLYGDVRVNSGVVSIRFRYAFRWGGKVSWYQCGTFPTIDIAVIRQNRDRARQLVSQGVNPNDEKKAARIDAQAAIEATIAEAKRQEEENKTVNDLFETWLSDGVARQNDNAELKRSFNKDVLPVIGDTPLRDLTDSDIRAMLRKMRQRGVTRMVVSAYNDINQMLAWGEKRQPWRSLLIDGNPCELVEVDKLLPSDYQEERDRILSPDEIIELCDIFKRMESDYKNASDKRRAAHPFAKRSQLALWLCLGTLCRIGELLMAEWKHVDFKAGVWFIPRENVKGRRDKKQEHYIFLSDFTRQQFEALKEITGKSEWCFPSKNRDGSHVCVKSISKQVGDRQVRFKRRSKPLKGRAFNDSLVLAGGANGEWTPHDLRRTGATMMQQLGVPLDIIDRCQNHVIAGSRVRRHYLHHDYKEEKTEAWGRLGVELERILS